MKKKKSKAAVGLNMSAAAARLGSHVSEVKRAKRAGSDAFLRSGRIDLARLRAWLKANPVETNSQDDAPHPELAGIDLDGLMKSLASAAEVEGKNFQLLRSAQARGDAVAAEAATAAFSRSQKNKLAIEAAVRKERQARGELMTTDQAKIAMNRLWVPAITLLRKLPRTLAPRVAPGDDVAAEKVLAEGVEEVIAEMRRSLTSEPDPQFHLNVYFAVMLREKNRAEILAHIDQVRKMAEAISE